MAEWIYSNDFPNWSTLIVEIGIGVGIALYLFHLQSKTNESNEAVISKINEATQKIDTYIEGKKKLEDTTKKFYVDKIIENLLYIKHQDQRTMEVMYRFQLDNQIPERDTLFWIYQNVNHIRIFSIPEIQDALQQLEGTLSYPNTRLEIKTYLTVLDGPFQYMAEDRNWQKKDFLVSTVTSILDIHLYEINWYIMLMALE